MGSLPYHSRHTATLHGLRFFFQEEEGLKPVSGISVAKLTISISPLEKTGYICFWKRSASFWEKGAPFLEKGRHLSFERHSNDV